MFEGAEEIFTKEEKTEKAARVKEFQAKIRQLVMESSSFAAVLGRTVEPNTKKC